MTKEKGQKKDDRCGLSEDKPTNFRKHPKTIQRDHRVAYKPKG